MFASSLLRDGKQQLAILPQPTDLEREKDVQQDLGKLSPFRNQFWLKNLSFQSPLLLLYRVKILERTAQLCTARENSPELKPCVEPLLRPKFALNTTGEAPTCIWEQQQHKPVPGLLSLLGISGAEGWRPGGSLKLLSNLSFGLKTIMEKDRKAWICWFSLCLFLPSRKPDSPLSRGESLGQTTLDRHMPWILEYTGIQLSRCLERHQHWKLQQKEQRNTLEAALPRNKLCPGTRQLKVAS